MVSNNPAGSIDWRLLGTALGIIGVTAFFTVATVVFGSATGVERGLLALVAAGLGVLLLLFYFAATTATPGENAHATVEIGYAAKDGHMNADSAFHVVDSVLFLGAGLVAGGLIGLVVVW